MTNIGYYYYIPNAIIHVGSDHLCSGMSRGMFSYTNTICYEVMNVVH